MAVGDHIALCLGSSHCGGIAGYGSYFFYRILDSGSVAVLLKSCPGMGPSICTVQHNSCSLRCAVCIELHTYLFRTHSVLIVIVFPSFFYGYACRLRNRLPVGNRNRDTAASHSHRLAVISADKIAAVLVT